ncbi:hypothetical protein TNCV_4043321 [Trichonephila clavipes]|nr:hypothetical protein TNCV_4043321 [Trichonephila clavipes]
MEYQNLILDTSYPTVAWKKLLDHFQSNTRACVIGPLDEFFNSRILEGGNRSLCCSINIYHCPARRSQTSFRRHVSDLPVNQLFSRKLSREADPRPDGTRVDIYYAFERKSLSLRSTCDVENYCRGHNIKFDKKFFSFSQKDKYSSPVPKGENSTSEHPEAHHVEGLILRNFKKASDFQKRISGLLQ